MKVTRFLPLALTFLLAACGGGASDNSSPSTSDLSVSSFTANPPSITAGQSSTLSFAVVPATAAVFISEGIGTVAGTSVAVTPTVTTTYTLTATSEGQTATATTTVTVAASPSNPTPTPTPTPTPAPEIPYGGEWVWSFESDYGFETQGTASITEVLSGSGLEGGGGYWQECYVNTCFDEVEGVVFIGFTDIRGNSEDELVFALFEEDLAGDLQAIFLGIDKNGKLEKDSQGRDEMIGSGIYDRYGGALGGDFRGVLIGQNTTFGKLTPKLERQVRSLLR